MKPTAIVINTSRGPVVDQGALYEALRDGVIGGAALDVTDPEPMRADDPLLTLPNCLVVPHIASGRGRPARAWRRSPPRTCWRACAASRFRRPSTRRWRRGGEAAAPARLMSPLALGLALLAAFLHASWNLLLRRTDDTEAGTALIVCTGCVVVAPLAAATWSVQAAVVPYLFATWTFELIYFVLLAAAYRRAELSLVYPLARGTAPVVVLVVGVALLGVQPTIPGGVGVLLVGAGVLLVRGLRGGGDTAGTLLALATAAAIAGYTLVDRVGVTLAGAVTYLELAMVVPGVLYLVAVTYLRGATFVRAQFHPMTVVAGTLMISAYGLVLLALRLAPAASVAAVRESGVVMATAMAAVLLHERVSRERFAGAILVVAGIAALAVS